MRMTSLAVASAALLLLAGPALAGSSVSFPFKGSDSNTYTGQTVPTDGSGNVPMSAGGQPAATAAGQVAQQGSVGPGTPAAAAVLTGGIFKATPPTVADGQQSAIQLDANGNQKVVAVGGATAAKQPALGTAGSPSADVLTVQPPAGAPLAVDTVIRSTATPRGAILPVQAASAAIAAGGSGAAVGDVLTEVGGTCSVQPKFNVATVSSGAVATVTVNTAGSCTALPTNPVATTSSGAGTGATLTVSYAGLAFQMAPANTSRRLLHVQPQGGIAYLSGTATATADYNSLKIAADALYETSPVVVGTGAISMITAGTVPLPVYAREF